MSTRSLLAFYALALVQVCLSAVSNRTIDDFNGDAVTGALPVYEGGWNVDGNCTTCFVQPVSNQAFDHTWHDTTGQNSVTLQFTGTAIYFFGIVPNTVPFADTLVNVTFTVDGAFVGSYTHIPDTSSTILYNVPMLSAEGLSNKAHTLVAKVSDLLLFDFAIYTWVNIIRCFTKRLTN
ncbi:hypothetical protein B0H19DRAFT_957811 [Mycena capillaripes]|nr:hypothetical protein B0H19DRAFT_957811 [Mycena capillaripes]